MASISRRDWMAPALAALLALACYLPALNGEPIAEDRALIFESPATRTPSAAIASFTRPFWHGLKPVQPYYRPLPILTWSLERWGAGGSAAVHHAVNTCLHALNAALAALLVLGLSTLAGVGAFSGVHLAGRGGSSLSGSRDRGRHRPAADLDGSGGGPGVLSEVELAERGLRPAPHPAAPLALSTAGALFAGALVAVHPLHSEPVAALYGRPDLLAATGTLLFLNLAVRGRWLLSLLALAGALFSKESALLMPLLAPVVFAAGTGWRANAVLANPRPGSSSKGLWTILDPGRLRRSRAEHDSRPIEGSRLRALLPGVLAAVIVLGAYLLMRYVALGVIVDPSTPHRLDNPLVRAGTVERWLTPLAVGARTARIAIWPDRLCADRGFDTVPLASSIGDAWALSGAGVLCLSIILIAILAARRSPWALAAAAALLAWLPASNLIVLAPVLMAERLAYMPSIFACVLAGGLCSELLGRSRRAPTSTMRPLAGLHRSSIPVLCAAALVGLAARAFARASDFRTEISFYESDTRQCPRSVKAHYNLGNVLARSGRHAEAVESFARATAIDPTLAIAHSNRGASFLALMRLDGAERSYREALSIDPELVTARTSLAGVLFMLGRLDESLAEAETALASKPSPSDAAQIRELIHRIRRGLGSGPRP